MQALVLTIAVLVSGNVGSEAADIQEVAQGKPGTMPKAVYSTPQNDASKITDGNTDVQFGRDGTCTLVGRMIRPWITIDLGKTYYVDHVNLFMRGDEITKIRDTDIAIQVGNDPNYILNDMCGEKKGYFGREGTIKCTHMLAGRYVTIYRNNDQINDYLQVCEMQVFADLSMLGACACHGDPHCRSFDRAPWLHYQGSCSYTMFRDNCENGLPNGPASVEVVIDNKPPFYSDKPVSLVRAVHIILRNPDMKIKLDQKLVTTVNGVTVQGTPYHPNDKVTITTTSGQVYVALENGIRVRYDGKYSVTVDIPKDLQGKVCGICGNANGDRDDDWMVGPSKDCMNDFPDSQPGSITDDLNEVGNSWLAYIDDDPTCPTECPKPPPPPGCTTVSHEKAKEHCEILLDMDGPFGECLKAIPEDQRSGYFDNCVYDSCALEIYDTIVCSFARALSEDCKNDYNFDIEWRKPDFCPLPCPPGMTRKTCGYPCMPTCSDAEGNKCDIPENTCEEGCFCNEGMVFDGTKCIPASTCGCLYPEQNVYIPVGDSFTYDDCSKKCTCSEAGGDLVCTDFGCEVPETCEKVDGEATCICAAPFTMVDGNCVREGCLDPSGISIAVGETYKSDDCSKTCTCEGNGQAPKCQDTSCTAPETCKEVDGEPSCVCEAPYQEVNGKCVEAGCRYEKEDILVGVGESVMASDCSETCECKTAGGELECTESSCTVLETCGKENGEPKCLCKDENVIIDGVCRHPSFACTLPKDGGSGGSSLQRFYFNQVKCLCKPFTYKGEGGNLNNFASEEECQQRCSEFETPLECLEPYDEGTCDDRIIKYYYNPEIDLCKKLFYTGCGGNQNRFDAKDKCRYTCKRC